MRIRVSTQVTIVMGLGAIAGALVLFGCQQKSTVASWQTNGTPVHMDPDEPWWNYQLVYHPNSGVYFEPYSQTWHWQEDGEWRSSSRRPEPVAWHADEAVVVKLNWETPEFGHTSVAMQHPQTGIQWSRQHPITVPSLMSDDTALTNAKSNANVESLCTCDDSSYTIVMPKSAQGSMTSSKPAMASAEPSSPESEESPIESESESASESEATAVAGATSSDNPE